MFEAGLVVVAILALLGFAMMPASWALVGGAALTLLSLVIGTGTGIVYHVLLARALGSRLPRGWWWNPTPHHEHLEPDQRGRVLGWFYVGAAGFVGCILGLAMVVTGAVKSL